MNPNTQTIGAFHQVGMTSPVDHVFSVAVQIPLAENGIIGSRDIRAFRVIRNKNYFAVPVASATFSAGSSSLGSCVSMAMAVERVIGIC